MINKGKTLILSLIAISIISLFTVNGAKAQGNVHVSLDMFYDELSPYGYWDYDPNYGGDIWYPQAGHDFRPYSSNGYWTMTQYGNTWVSNYPWGWATFHYGRWINTPRNGWGWIPDYEWGPAWVDWRSGNGYYGWAPMAPRLSVNISVGLPINLWIFSPSKRIYDRNIHRYSTYGRPNIYNNTTIINNTYIVNNNHYYGGPSRRDVERTTGRKVTVRDVRNADRPGSSRIDNKSVSIYRPQNNTRAQSTSRDSRTNTANRSATNSNTTNRARQEMYIGRDGNAIIRDRSDNSRVITNDRKTESRNSTLSTNRGNDRSTSNRNTTENKSPINRGESSRVRREVQQIPQRDNTPSRERQRSTIPVQQASTTRASNNSSTVSRNNTPRVERTTSSSSRNDASSPSRTSTDRSSNSRR
ncbi:DUF6600 domain-containing protein [Sphingobacterium rhinopitheci]|uniref:DUF6600 domain-containing protein n=1 Tax=Sphingobacterium rhinopitheci TaxID=2781960 RepID=UPI001F516E68|nr:DUF6600 domain-containing protein [Sphingobacterium rhinopitheci]MCI0920247.1 hypothetical protein [Sphingobacterium rhinopitheci]